jgi:hypothetical protein
VKIAGQVHDVVSTRRPEPVGQHARQVAGQPAAGDVAERVDLDLVDEGEARPRVDAGRLEQHLAERPVETVRLGEVRPATMRRTSE